MNKHLFAVESVTYARKGQDLLRQAGLQASVKRIPRLRGGGCGFGIEDVGDPERIKGLLEKGGVKVLYVEAGGA